MRTARTIIRLLKLELLTEISNGFRLARRQDGCRNVFAVFNSNREVCAVRCVEMLPGGAWAFYGPSSEKFPADAAPLVSFFLARCREYRESGRGWLQNPMTYCKESNVATGMSVGVLNLDGDECILCTKMVAV